MLVELSREDIKHIRTALAYMLIQYHDMVETGTLVTHGDVDHLIEAAQDAAEFQEKLRLTLAKLPPSDFWRTWAQVSPYNHADPSNANLRRFT